MKARSRRLDDEALTRLKARCRVDRETGCWIWTGCADSRNARGLVKWGGKVQRAHRLAWRLARRQLPKGALLITLCEDARCIRPDPGHQRVVTRRALAAVLKDNGRLSAGMLHSMAVTRGLRNSKRTKLTLQKAERIRRRRAADTPIDKIASQFRVHPSTVRKIERFRLWRTGSPFGGLLRPDQARGRSPAAQRRALAAACARPG